MEYNIFQESSIWRNSRDKRIVSFVRIAAWMMIVVGAVWIPISLFFKMYFVIAMTVALIISGIFALKFLKKNRILISKILIFATVTLYFLVICIFVDGVDDITHERGQAHFWFIVLAFASYFILYDIKPLIRDTIPVVLLVLFFLFHFGYITIHPMVNLQGKDMLNRLTIITSLACMFLVTRQFIVQITKAEQALSVSADRLEGLLESMLPPSVAERLRLEGKTFADEFHDCSVLFADIVNFSEWSEHHSANEVVDRLNIVFSKFDEIVDRMKLTKIKTIGDSYMVAAGVPVYMEDHAIVLTNLALELNEIASQYTNLNFRIGINSGSVVAGIIGKKIFLYDLWGDTVNIASRMESSGEAGKVNISGATFKLIKDKFNCTYRGKVQAKNRGEIDMYFVSEKIDA